MTRLSRMSEPKNSPKAFLQRGRPSGTRTLVVCAGDSITHGVASANYVAMLDKQFAPAGFAFVNAGINGNLAWNVLQRLDDMIACRPDAVTLLVGTNDVNATFDAEWEASYRREQKLPVTPTLAWFCQNVECILDRLRAETNARLAILDLPMLGENLDSAMNRRIAVYNDALRAIAAAKRVTCLPLHERLCARLPSKHVPPPYEGKKETIARAAFKHYLLRKSWDAVSSDHGLVLLTDHIHLNDRGAAVAAALIGDFLVTSAG